MWSTRSRECPFHFLVQVRNRAGGSVAPHATKPLFQKIDDNAMDLFPGEMDYISMLVSITDNSVGEGGQNRYSLEDGRVRVVLSGIDDALIGSADAARDLQAIAKGVPDPSEVEEAIKRKSYGGNLGEAIQIHHNSQSGSYHPLAARPTAIEPLSISAPPTARDEYPLAGVPAKLPHL